MSKVTLVLHGGCGLVFDQDKYESEMLRIAAEGQKLLLQNKSAVDVVEHCVMLLEDSDLFNAGKGSVLNARGGVEMDAAIMNGVDLSCGAVAAVSGIRNPVQLARKVMEKSEHVLLIGDGANEFAEQFQEDIETETSEYFITEGRLQQFKKAQEQDVVVLDHTHLEEQEKKFGTVGAVALDSQGNLAAATSTGGVVNKKFGRVGDSPIIGAGTWADNETCAVSATGYGEQLMRSVIGKTTSDFIAFKQFDAQRAAEAAVDYLVNKVKGLGGVIVVDKQGKIGLAHSTPNMIVSFVHDDKDPQFHLKS